MSDGGRGTAAPLIARQTRQVRLAPWAFWETRGGSGTPVVLIHGLGGSSEWWQRNFDALAERHLVAAVDLVGFGRNRFFLKRSSLPLPFAEIAALLARWIESSFDGPVHLVGNSMGGHITIHLAASRPELVRSATLVDATGVPFRLNPRAHLASLAVPRGVLSFAQILARDSLRAGPTSVALALTRILRDDVRPLLRSMRMPVLLLWGESDPLVPLTYAEQMQQELPNARLEVLPDAGHVPMWENPPAFNEALLRFLDDVDAGEPVDAPPPRGAFGWGIAGFTNGMAHREAGGRRDVVLVHGLGMSSAYFAPFASTLFARGLSPIAPDLRGFGESLDAPACGPDEHARQLAAWADVLGIRDAVWIGHSTGCHAVAHLAALRPDLVRRAAYVGSLWTGARHPLPRFAAAIALDAFREPLALWRYILPAYWRAGALRWWLTFRRHLPDTLRRPPTSPPPIVLAGKRDPLVDHGVARSVDDQASLDLPGAHACLFDEPEATANALLARL